MKAFAAIVSLCVALCSVSDASAQGYFDNYNDLRHSLGTYMNLMKDAAGEGDAESIQRYSAEIARITAAMDKALERGETPYDWYSRTQLQDQMQSLWQDVLEATFAKEYTASEEYEAARALRRLRMTCIALAGNFRKELEDLKISEALLRIRLDSPLVMDYEKKPARHALETNLSLQASVQGKMFLSQSGALFFSLVQPLPGKKIERWPSVSFF